VSIGPLTDAHAAMSQAARIQAMLDVEVALVEALAGGGLIPASAVPAGPLPTARPTNGLAGWES